MSGLDTRPPTPWCVQTSTNARASTAADSRTARARATRSPVLAPRDGREEAFRLAAKVQTRIVIFHFCSNQTGGFVSTIRPGDTVYVGCCQI